MDYNILQFIWDKQSVDAPTLQYKFGIPYKKAMSIIDELTRKDALRRGDGDTRVVHRRAFLELTCDDSSSFFDKLSDAGNLPTEEYDKDTEFYIRALYRTICDGRVSTTAIMRAFDASPRDAVEAVRWMSKNGYVRLVDMTQTVILTREDFMKRFGKVMEYYPEDTMEEESDDADDCDTDIIEVKDLDYNDDDDDDNDDDVDEESFEEIVERMRKLSCEYSEYLKDKHAVVDFDDIVEIGDDDEDDDEDEQSAQEGEEDFIEAAKKVLLFVMESEVRTVYDTMMNFNFERSRFYFILHWLTQQKYLQIEPELEPLITVEEFERLFGNPEKYRIDAAYDYHDFAAVKTDEYDKAFLEKAKTALWYVIKYNRLSYVELKSVLSVNFETVYEIVNWMCRTGYVYEDTVVGTAEKFVKNFGNTAKYDAEIERLLSSRGWYDDQFGMDKMYALGTIKLTHVKQRFRNIFSVDRQDKDVFVVSVDSCYSFAFRLHTDGARVYISDCSGIAELADADGVDRIVASYDCMARIGNTVYVEFLDINYAGAALLNLYSAMREIKDIVEA